MPVSAPERRAAHHEPEVADHVADAGDPAVADEVLLRDRVVLAQHVDDLGQGEGAERDDDQRHAVRQVERVEGEAVFGRRLRRADGADQEAEGAGGEALHDVRAGQHADEGQREDDQHELLAEADREQDRPRGHEREGQHERAEQAADQRGGEGGAERARAFAALRHRKAVEHGRRGAGAARHADQHGAERVGGRRHRGEADHHGQRRPRVHAEDEGQDHRHAGQAADARQDADHHAECRRRPAGTRDAARSATGPELARHS